MALPEVSQQVGAGIRTQSCGSAVL